MSKRWGRALAGLIEGISALQKPWRRASTRLHAAHFLLQRCSLSTPYGPIVLVAGDPAELHYARDFAAREPETLTWIDGFATPCSFWDVGANIGCYSLYAAARPGIQVTAFEPAAANYLSLCRNLTTNGFDAKARAYCIALADRTELGELKLSDTTAGSVFNAFNTDEDCFGAPLRVAARQGILGLSIDGFRRLFDLPAPNYLKIDVDSIEERILSGASETLRDPELRSVLIEIEEADTPRNGRLIAALEASGLRLALRSPGNRGGGVNGIFTRHAASLGTLATALPQDAVAAP